MPANVGYNPDHPMFDEHNPNTWSPMFKEQVMRDSRNDDLERHREMMRRFAGNSGKMMWHIARRSPRLVRRSITNFNQARRHAMRRSFSY